jgi:hypothetical protein
LGAATTAARCSSTDDSSKKTTGIALGELEAADDQAPD